MRTKEQLKAILDTCLHYINAGSPMKEYHQQKYQATVIEFNKILARESK